MGSFGGAAMLGKVPPLPLGASSAAESAAGAPGEAPKKSGLLGRFRTRRGSKDRTDARSETEASGEGAEAPAAEGFFEPSSQVAFHV
jgi:hypothetical protein